jgi:hypothetical protein
MVGKMTLYNPVTTGVWEIDVYPIHSGIAIAARVTPAITSPDNQPGLYPRRDTGRILVKTDIATSHESPSSLRSSAPPQ